MGNCTCSRVKEENESQYDDNYLEITLDGILEDILSSPDRPRFADFLSDGDDDYDVDYDDDEDNDGGSGILRDVSFERDSNISKLENIFIEDELCGICAFNFDEDQHIPRILPCGHTFCYYCIRKLARRYKFEQLMCPLDRKRHILKQRHTDDILTGGQSSSTVSIASSDTGLVLSLDLFHRPNGNNINNTEVQIDESITDFSSDDGGVESFLDLMTRHPNYNTPGSHSDILLDRKSHNMTSKYAVQYPYVDSEITNSDETGTQIMTLHTTNLRHSSMFRSEGRQSSCEEYDDCDDEVNELSDVNSFRPITEDDVDNTDQDDVYADERSVRSYDWIEPDYD